MDNCVNLDLGNLLKFFVQSQRFEHSNPQYSFTWISADAAQVERLLGTIEAFGHAVLQKRIATVKVAMKSKFTILVFMEYCSIYYK